MIGQASVQRVVVKAINQWLFSLWFWAAQIFETSKSNLGCHSWGMRQTCVFKQVRRRSLWLVSFCSKQRPFVHSPPTKQNIIIANKMSMPIATNLVNTHFGAGDAVFCHYAGTYVIQ
jgi:hypothetical protein